jgi:hypothetical protein
MGFKGTAKVSTNALGQLLFREDSIAFDDLALSMGLLGFDRIESGTLLGQPEQQNMHPNARLLDLLVMGLDPAPHVCTRMLGGVIPDEQPIPHPLLSQKHGYTSPKTVR